MTSDLMKAWQARPGETGALAAMRAAAAPAGLGSSRAFDPYEQPRYGLLQAIGTVEQMAHLLRSAAAWVSPHASDPVHGGHLYTAMSRNLESLGQAPLTPLSEMAPAPSALAWSYEDSAAATGEGWDVFDSSERGLEIERIDAPEDAAGEIKAPAFATDDEAIGYVYGKAQEGSPLHQKALLLTLTWMKGFAWTPAVSEHDAHHKSAHRMSDGDLLLELATPRNADEAAETLSRVFASGADAQLAQVVRVAISRLEQLGFSDPDAPVDGGDCVDLVGELLPHFRRAVGMCEPEPEPEEGMRP